MTSNQTILTMTPTDHEKSEWARFSTALNKSENYHLASEFLAASKMEEGTKISLHTFDYLQSKYRAWLVFNEIN